jgi:hypothetical protein
MAKKLLKKLGKAAALAGALYGATKLGRKRATDLPGNAMAKAKRLMTSDAAYTGGGYDDAIRRAHTLTEPEDLGIMGYKKGGRVTGAAKRGFGRALMKGKK